MNTTTEVGMPVFCTGFNFTRVGVICSQYALKLPKLTSGIPKVAFTILLIVRITCVDPTPYEDDMLVFSFWLVDPKPKAASRESPKEHCAMTKQVQ